MKPMKELWHSLAVIAQRDSGGSRKKYWGRGEASPSSFGRQQRLSEITIEPIKNWGDWARFGGLCPPALA